MADLKTFSRRIRVIANKIEDNADIMVRKTALAIDQELVISTPVDTGRARSNWQVSTGKPITFEIEPYSPGSNLGRSEAANAQAALAQGREAIARREKGEDVIISNNVGYIKFLNDGSSAQAPEMFIEQAIQTGARVARNHKLLP